MLENLSTLRERIVSEWLRLIKISYFLQEIKYNIINKNITTFKDHITMLKRNESFV